MRVYVPSLTHTASAGTARIAVLIFIRRVLVAAAAALAFWTILIMIFEDRFIFFPSPYPHGPYEELPARVGGRDEFFTTEDGVRLHAWYAPAEPDRMTVVMSHGNAGNVSHRIELMRLLKSIGLSVFAFDYRGYGRSEGNPSEDGVYRDARAAYDHVRSLGIPADRILLWGSSLGGAVAVDLATHRPSAGLILEATFTSAYDVAAAVYPYLPVRWVMKTSFDSESKIRTVNVPSLHLHGEHDEIIPPMLGRKLFEAAPEPKEFYLIPGAGHNDTFWVGGKDYLDRIRTFTDSLISRD